MNGSILFFKVNQVGYGVELSKTAYLSYFAQTDTLVSWKFRIGNDIYSDLFADMSRYYYYQRQGMDLDEKYAGDFARQNLHPEDIAIRRWSDRENPDAVT